MKRRAVVLGVLLLVAFVCAGTLSASAAPPASAGRPSTQTALELWRPFGESHFLSIPLALEVRSGRLGYLSGYSATAYGGTSALSYDACFQFNPNKTPRGWSWDSKSSRIVYLYDGLTKVTLGGETVPVESARAKELLATGRVSWACEYRARAEQGFEGWVVLELKGIRE